jgi:7,8-dihydroneopterin aldolase/epimerase/oxygenase
MSHAMLSLVAEDENDEPVASCYRIRLEDFVVTLSIGAYEHERDRPQRVRIDLEMTIDQDVTAIGDRLSAVVSYDGLLDRIEEMASRRHINLLETLALEVADICFTEARVRCVSVSVKRLDIFDGRAVPCIQLDVARPGLRGAAPRR